jgi:hypothetical protein
VAFDDLGTSASLGRDRRFAPDEALAEIDRVTRRLRPGLYWEVLQAGTLAIFMVATLLVRHAYPRHATRFLIASLVVLAVVGVLVHWRRRAVDRGSERRNRIVGWLFIPLYLAAGAVLGSLGSHEMSPLVIAIATLPALPLLGSAMWALRR